MRIVMVGPFGMRPRGTMGVRALPMARALVARGHAVTMVMPPWQNPEDAGRCWREDGVEIENVSLPPRVPGLFHLLTALRLTRRVMAIRPDVVHLFKPKAYSGLSHWLLVHWPNALSGARRLRLVVDTDDWEGPGGWNTIADYSPAQRRFFTWQERWGLTHADAVTVASRTLQSLVWALGVPPARVFYVPNGVSSNGIEELAVNEADPLNFQGTGSRNSANAPRPRHGGEFSGLKSSESPPRTRAVSDKTRLPQQVKRIRDRAAPTILLYTRFFEFPVSRLVEVFKRVREQVPDARLLVVGQGLFGEEVELFRRAARAGWTVEIDEGATSDIPLTQSLTQDITHVGWVPAETLPAYFARADVAIYPFDDTLVNRTKCPVKLCDLLAAGVPVVAEAVGENREMIHHGETGWLVPPGDEGAFARAVVRLLTDDRLRGRLGQIAACDVRRRQAWEILVKTVERAYGISGGMG